MVLVSSPASTTIVSPAAKQSACASSRACRLVASSASSKIFWNTFTALSTRRPVGRPSRFIIRPPSTSASTSSPTARMAAVFTTAA